MIVLYRKRKFVHQPGCRVAAQIREAVKCQLGLKLKVAGPLDSYHVQNRSKCPESFGIFSKEKADAQ